jgi:NTP pyrophosphatase (non-canonical NTP hydrolase)
MFVDTSTYQALAQRTLNPDLTPDEVLLMCGLGIPGEAGEVADHIKKACYHRGKPLNVEKIGEELGDLLWYVAVLCTRLNLSLDEVMCANIAKLEERHGAGFRSQYKSDSGDSE